MFHESPDRHRRGQRSIRVAASAHFRAAILAHCVAVPVAGVAVAALCVAVAAPRGAVAVGLRNAALKQGAGPPTLGAALPSRVGIPLSQGAVANCHAKQEISPGYARNPVGGRFAASLYSQDREKQHE